MILLDTAQFESPLGTIFVAVREGRVCALNFLDPGAAPSRWLERRFGPFELRRAHDPAGIVSALSGYFAGRLEVFDGIAVDAGGTPFQASVWSELRRVPAGRTISYGALASAIGSPRAARAVGAANAQNPVAIVIPCHRAIGSDHRLVGYAAGLDRKRWLLRHEGVLRFDALNPPLPLAG